MRIIRNLIILVMILIPSNGSFNDFFQECTNIKILVDTDKMIVIFMLWPSDKWSITIKNNLTLLKITMIF